MAPPLKSYFETTINLNQNNYNFGETIYLKSRAEHQAAKRYLQAKQPHTNRHTDENNYFFTFDADTNFL